MVQDIINKLDLGNLTMEEQIFIQNLLKSENEKEQRKVAEKVAKIEQNKVILDKIDEMIESQEYITATEVYKALGRDKKYSIQKVSYVIRELSDLVAIDNPLYAVKVYKRATEEKE